METRKQLLIDEQITKDIMEKWSTILNKDLSWMDKNLILTINDTYEQAKILNSEINKKLINNG